MGVCVQDRRPCTCFGDGDVMQREAVAPAQSFLAKYSAFALPLTLAAYFSFSFSPLQPCAQCECGPLAPSPSSSPSFRS